MHECKMSDHVEICAGELIKCPYNICGCVTMLPRSRILAHLHRCRYSPRTVQEDDTEEEIFYIEIKTGRVCTQLPKNRDENNGTNEIENERIEEEDDEAIQEPIEIQCPICIEEFNIQECVQCLNLNEIHAFCKNCIKAHIETNVDELLLADSADGINCLIPECIISNLVDGKVAQRLGFRFIDQNLAPMQNIERCKSCHFAMEIEDSFDQTQFFICQMCHAIFCRRCQRDDNKHYNGNTLITCETLDQQEAEKSLRNLENEMSEAVIRKCLKCSLAFIKLDGCNKMTCRCGATQCYICKAPNIDYNHFCCGRNKEPGKPCNLCNKTCLLREKAELKDEEVLKKIRERNNVNAPRSSKDK
uniref:RING-type domain-containing protein n=1 Tax=Acrobeloides nanus TaxID=290746 RepID=A0A914CME3_9BILA